MTTEEPKKSDASYFLHKSKQKTVVVLSANNIAQRVLPVDNSQSYTKKTANTQENVYIPP